MGREIKSKLRNETLAATFDFIYTLQKTFRLSVDRLPTLPNNYGFAWSTLFWEWLHDTSVLLSLIPESELRDDMLVTFLSIVLTLDRIMPCNQCVEHFRQNKHEFEMMHVKNLLASNHLVEGVWLLHNFINFRVHKPPTTMPFDEFVLKFGVVDERTDDTVLNDIRDPKLRFVSPSYACFLYVLAIARNTSQRKLIEAIERGDRTFADRLNSELTKCLSGGFRSVCELRAGYKYNNFDGKVTKMQLAEAAVRIWNPEAVSLALIALTKRFGAEVEQSKEGLEVLENEILLLIQSHLTRKESVPDKLKRVGISWDELTQAERRSLV
ncbi:hypothetical protein QAD02_001426 [Eretmocerus hayati]|uniref:Uncharacterized protein n=1 Tax=Eretmocerus hayati TaxID=131215 RepID=A0ACC2NIU7_9HYME|nr:hypothetical protein QAD02_001426 [Eretmocerus hayati]